MTALTHITAPSKKLILTTLGLVVGAHLLTGGVLSNMAPTPLPKQILPEPKPIEIEMVTLAPIEEKEPEPEIIRQKETEPEMRRASARKVVKKPPTSTKQAPKPKTQTQPPVNSRPANNKPRKPKQDTNPPKENNNSGGSSSVNPDVPLTNINESHTVFASPNGNQSSPSTSGSQTNTGGSQGTDVNKGVGSGSGGSPDPTPPPAPPAPPAPPPPAPKPTGPVKFSASDASWIDPPNLRRVANSYFRGKQNAEAITVTLVLTVNKQGKVTDADVISDKVDAATRNQIIRAAKKARLNPFTQNKAPVVGKVNVPFRLEPNG